MQRSRTSRVPKKWSKFVSPATTLRKDAPLLWKSGLPNSKVVEQAASAD
jgi:hypothetical protein